MAENEAPRIMCSPVKGLGSPTKSTLKGSVSTNSRTPLKSIGNSPQKPKQNLKVGVTPSKYKALEQLDEEVGWQERTEVVTSVDHAAYNTYAKELLDEVVTKALDNSIKSEPTRISAELDKPVASQETDSACCLNENVLQTEGSKNDMKPKGTNGETTFSDEFFDTVENSDEDLTSDKENKLPNESSETTLNALQSQSAVVNSPNKSTSEAISKDNILDQPVEAINTLKSKGQTATESKYEDIAETVDHNIQVVVNDAKTSEKDVVSSEGEAVVEEKTEQPEESQDIIVSTKGYALDFLDDPNFNPFQTKSAVSNSPDKANSSSKSKEGQTATESKIEDSTKEDIAETVDHNIQVATNDAKNSEKDVASSEGEAVVKKKTEQPEESQDIIVSTKGYALDFLDDPNFNPFQTKSAVSNSPDKANSSSIKENEISLTTKTETKDQLINTTNQTNNHPENMPENTVCTVPSKDPENKPDEQVTPIEEHSNKPDFVKAEVDMNKEESLQDITLVADSDEFFDTVENVDEIAVPKIESSATNEDGKVEQSLQNDTLQKKETEQAVTENKSDDKPHAEVALKDETIQKETALPESTVPQPENLEEIIVSAKGYDLNFLDNLDDPNLDPFKTKTTVNNSPDKSNCSSLKEKVTNSAETETKSSEANSNCSISDSNQISTKPEEVKILNPSLKVEIEKSDQKDHLKEMPIKDEGENTVPSKLEAKLNKNEQYKEEQIEKAAENLVPSSHDIKEETAVKGTPEKETPEDIIPAKSYDLNFLDKLDDPNFNPFVTKSAVNNSPDKSNKSSIDNENSINIKAETKGTEDSKSYCIPDSKSAICQPQEFSVSDPPTKIDTEIVEKKTDMETLAGQGIHGETKMKEKTPQKKIPPPSETSQSVQSSHDTKEETAVKGTPEKETPEDIIPAKGYDLNFLDKFDDPNFNPFDTKSAVINTPDKSNKSSMDNDVSMNIKAETNSEASKPDCIPDSKSTRCQPEEPIMNPPTKYDTKIGNEKKTDVETLAGQDLKGETKMKEKTPQKKISPPSETSQPEELEETIVPTKGYNLDFLADLDDPNYDPFKTNSTVNNSPGKADLKETESKGMVAKSINSKLNKSQSKKTNRKSEQKEALLGKEKEKKPQEDAKPISSEVKDTANLTQEKTDDSKSSSEDIIVEQNKSQSKKTNKKSEQKEALLGKKKEKKPQDDAKPLSSEVKDTDNLIQEKTDDSKSSGKDINVEKSVKGKTPIKTNKKALAEASKGTVSTKGYSLDILDNLDDPDFNPFATKNSMINSPEGNEASKHENEKPNSPKMEKKRLGEDACVFSPVPVSKRQRSEKACKDSPISKPNVLQLIDDNDDEFRSGSEFFNNMEDIDFLSQHGVEGDRVNLARNSLYVRFDPLVGGRPSLAPFIAQQFRKKLRDEELDDSRRDSGLISFSPGPKNKHPSCSEEGGDVTASFLDNTVVESANDTTVMASQTLNTTTVFNATVKDNAANATMIHIPAPEEKTVPEKEMNERLQKMELIMQDNLLRKSCEYQKILKVKEQEIEESSVVMASLEEENKTLRSKCQQLQKLLEMVKETHDTYVREHEEKLYIKEAEHKEVCQQLREDLSKQEESFIDQVKKFERVREASLILKKNNEGIKSELETLKSSFAIKEQTYMTVVKSLEENFGKGKDEYEKLKQKHEQELKKAHLMVRKSELEITTLKDTVEKKTSENERLTNLIDEMSKY